MQYAEYCNKCRLWHFSAWKSYVQGVPVAAAPGASASVPGILNSAASNAQAVASVAVVQEVPVAAAVQGTPVAAAVTDEAAKNTKEEEKMEILELFSPSSHNREFSHNFDFLNLMPLNGSHHLDLVNFVCFTLIRLYQFKKRWH